MILSAHRPLLVSYRNHLPCDRRNRPNIDAIHTSPRASSTVAVKRGRSPAPGGSSLSKSWIRYGGLPTRTLPESATHNLPGRSKRMWNGPSPKGPSRRDVREIGSYRTTKWPPVVIQSAPSLARVRLPTQSPPAIATSDQFHVPLEKTP